MKSFTTTLKVLALASALSLGVSFVYAWTGPTLPPPLGNVPAPINVGSEPQEKLGTFRLVGDASVPAVGDCAPEKAGTLKNYFSPAHKAQVKIGSITLYSYTVAARGGVYFCNGTEWRLLDFVPKAPNIQFTSSASVIAANQSVTLKWTVTDADSCTMDGSEAGKAFSGKNISPPYGELVIQPGSGWNDDADYTFKVSCTGPGGSSDQSLVVDSRSYKYPSLSYTGVNAPKAGESCREYLTRIHNAPAPVNESTILYWVSRWNDWTTGSYCPYYQCHIKNTSTEYVSDMGICTVDEMNKGGRTVTVPNNDGGFGYFTYTYPIDWVYTQQGYDYKDPVSKPFMTYRWNTDFQVAY